MKRNGPGGTSPAGKGEQRESKARPRRTLVREVGAPGASGGGQAGGRSSAR